MTGLEKVSPVSIQVRVDPFDWRRRRDAGDSGYKYQYTGKKNVTVRGEREECFQSDVSVYEGSVQNCCFVVSSCRKNKT